MQLFTCSRKKSKRHPFRFAEKQREKIYVLDGGKSLMLALSQDLSQNRPAEARDHLAIRGWLANTTSSNVSSGGCWMKNWGGNILNWTMHCSG